MTISLSSRFALTVKPQDVCLEEGPFATIYEDLLKTILSKRTLHVPPLVMRRGRQEVRSIIHSILVVSKRWNATMRELIVPLINHKTIQWTSLPPVHPLDLCKFLAQPSRGKRLVHLDLSKIGFVNADRLGEMVKACVHVQSLILSGCVFDLSHLLQLPKLKCFSSSHIEPLNVSVLGSLPSLESVFIKNALGDPTWTQLNTSTTLKKLHIHSKFPSRIKALPASLTSLSLFNTNFVDKDAFQDLTSLKHLSFSVIDDEMFHSLKSLDALDSLEIACHDLPADYLNSVTHIQRLKIAFAENIPNLSFFTKLSKLILSSVDYPDIGYLPHLTDLKMEKCTYDWRAFAGLKNLRKLTLVSWDKLPVGITLQEMPHLQILHIRSNKLETISARALTSLTCLKIECSKLKELTLPKGIAHTVKRDISKKARSRYIEEFPKGVHSEVSLF